MFDDHNGLTVTQLRINLDFTTSDPRVKAFANLTLNDAIAISAIRIVERENGLLLVAMPNRRRGDGTRRDTAFPIDHAARRWLNTVVLREYERACRRRVEAELLVLIKEAC